MTSYAVRAQSEDLSIIIVPLQRLFDELLPDRRAAVEARAAELIAEEKKRLHAENRRRRLDNGDTKPTDCD